MAKPNPVWTEEDQRQLNLLVAKKAILIERENTMKTRAKHRLKVMIMQAGITSDADVAGRIGALMVRSPAEFVNILTYFIDPPKE